MTEMIKEQPKRELASPEAQAFELVQRQATMLAASTLIPKEFQGNMANCAIGLNIAKRLGADPFMVLQNIDVIHGRPSFRASFLIAMVNASGRFSPLQFRLTDNDGCVAYAKDLTTGDTVEGPEVTLEMAKAEGWSTKNGSKWKTMPQLMLRYRSAAFFARIYAPDITLGMQTAEELNDVGPKAANAIVIEDAASPSFLPPAAEPEKEPEPEQEVEPQKEEKATEPAQEKKADPPKKEAKPAAKEEAKAEEVDFV